jgi:surfactin synthase thioesterase subunit
MTRPGETLALPATRSIECFQRAPRRSLRQIWCFPHAGAGAAEFGSWTAAAGSGTLICAVRLPGRERRIADVSHFADLHDASAVLAGEIAPLIEPGAVFYGQCLGAYLAYEVIVQLMRAGTVVPRRLFAASQEAPPCGPPTLPPERMSLLDGPALRAAVGELGGLPDGLPDKLWALVEPALRADLELSEGYRGPSAVITVPITALVGSKDSQISRGNVWGWQALSTAGFDLEIVPGEHFLSRSSPSEIIKVINQKHEGR